MFVLTIVVRPILYGVMIRYYTQHFIENLPVSYTAQTHSKGFTAFPPVLRWPRPVPQSFHWIFTRHIHRSETSHSSFLISHSSSTFYAYICTQVLRFMHMSSANLALYTLYTFLIHKRRVEWNSALIAKN